MRVRVSVSTSVKRTYEEKSEGNDERYCGDREGSR